MILFLDLQIEKVKVMMNNVAAYGCEEKVEGPEIWSKIVDLPQIVLVLFTNESYIHTFYLISIISLFFVKDILGLTWKTMVADSECQNNNSTQWWLIQKK